MTRTYNQERDILTVKTWLLNLAELRGIGYVDQGNTITITFPEDYKVPEIIRKEVKPHDSSKQHRAGRPKKTPGSK